MLILRLEDGYTKSGIDSSNRISKIVIEPPIGGFYFIFSTASRIFSGAR